MLIPTASVNINIDSGRINVRQNEYMDECSTDRHWLETFFLVTEYANSCLYIVCINYISFVLRQNKIQYIRFSYMNYGQLS